MRIQLYLFGAFNWLGNFILNVTAHEITYPFWD